MSEVANLPRYTILKVLPSDDGINIYIANKNDCDKDTFFLVNEIYDRAVINRYAPDLISLKQENMGEFIEYFSKDSKLYFVFSYSSGKDVIDVLSKEKLPFDYRVFLLQKIVYRMTEYPAVSNLVKTMLLQGENIVVNENLISLNCKFTVLESMADYKVQVYLSFGKLMTFFFTESEFEKYSILKVILSKCEKGIYHSFGEVLKDMETIFHAIDKDKDLKLLLVEKKEKSKKLVSRLLTVVVLLAACWVVYLKLHDSNVDNATYTDVDEIGTVEIGEKQPEKEADDSSEDENYVFIENVTAKNEEPEAATIDEALPVDEPGTATIDEAIPVDESEAEAAADSENQPPQDNLFQDENGGWYKIYVVKKQDYVSKIVADEYGTSDAALVKRVLAYNKMENGNLIFTGQEIRLPVFDE